jgi:hypothetical protein
MQEAPEQRWEGVADLAGRRAHVSWALFFTDGATAAISEPGEPAETEMVFDGANSYMGLGDAWTTFFPTDRDGPRGPNDPLWPLDALFGANDEAVLVAAEAVRGVATTHYRLTVDLARADAALPAGVTVPPGPYRALRQLPAEVWLDAAGLARRIAVDPEPTAARGRHLWTVTELWDFGVTADIAVPGPDEIISRAEALRRAEQEG